MIKRSQLQQHPGADEKMAAARRGKRIALFPLPLQGHVTPMLQLANILYSKGFSISIIHTKFNSPNPANHNPNFSFHPIDDGLVGGEASMGDMIALFTILNVRCVDPLRDCLSQMMLSKEGDGMEPIACLITDTMFHFALAVADGLKLPRLALRTSNASSFVALTAFPLLKEKGYLPVQDPQSEEPVVELPPLKVKDIPQISASNPEALFVLATRICEETKASNGLILNTFEELEGPALARVRQEFGIPVFPIGPFHKRFPDSSTSMRRPDQTSISWLNTQAPKSVLYVSFGSAAAVDEAEFNEIAWGLANSKQPFLWVVRPGLVRGTNCAHPLPDGVVETVTARGHIVEWAPQLEVLAHPAVGGFWTHSGWNSTLESICEGVPMICLPMFADQMINARYVTDVWGIGIRLEGKKLERGEIETVIRRFMVEKEGEGMRKRVACLREQSSLCLGEGGSSYTSVEYLATQISSF
ncbi:hypothetical protein Dimus_033730 [Dionaea muscipula]